MSNLAFNYNDGGRSQYFRAAGVGDCVTRSIAIASGRDYKEVYDLIFRIAKKTPRDGVTNTVIRKVMKELGAEWVPTMSIGSGCKCHLRAGEIPMVGNIVCNVSRHLTAVIDGVINDTFDPSRDGNRCVYGYWWFGKKGGTQ